MALSNRSSSSFTAPPAISEGPGRPGSTRAAARADKLLDTGSRTRSACVDPPTHVARWHASVSTPRLLVSDTGIAIPESKQAEPLTRFLRASATRARDPVTRLGLTMAESVVVATGAIPRPLGTPAGRTQTAVDG